MELENGAGAGAGAGEWSGSLRSCLGLKSEEKLVCYANICFGLAWHRQWKALELF